MGRLLLMHLVILQGIGLALVMAFANAAWARQDRGPAGLARIESRMNSEVIHIRGTLKCQLPEANTGQACTLKVVEQSTGNTLRVIGSDEAMRLYQNGKTEVSAQGTVQGDALRVNSIQSI